MNDFNWLIADTSALYMVPATAVLIYFLLVLLTRLAGLRSFSKMSGFDFAITVGIGTVLAGTLMNEKPPLLQGAVALGVLFAIQFSVAYLRNRSRFIRRLVDNEPLLLMAGEEVLEDNLRRARITPDDLKGKLREANVLRPAQIRAVVMETTGDVSVLHGDPDGPSLDLDLLSDVRGVERLRAPPAAG